jgi:hypothetical protein
MQFCNCGPCLPANIRCSRLPCGSERLFGPVRLQYPLMFLTFVRAALLDEGSPQTAFEDDISSFWRRTKPLRIASSTIPKATQTMSVNYF